MSNLPIGLCSPDSSAGFGEVIVNYFANRPDDNRRPTPVGTLNLDDPNFEFALFSREKFVLGVAQ